MHRRLFCLAIAFCHAAAAHAQLSTELVTGGLNVPIYLTAPNGDDRLFVLQRGGGIRVIDNGTLQGPSFLSIPGISTAGEGGLLGLAFHPDYAANGKLYVNYTIDTNPGTGVALRTVIEEYVVNDPAANVASIASQRTIITIDQPFTNHNGGWLGFDPTAVGAARNHLYIPTGDGGDANDPGDRARNLGDLLGKVLRLDISGTQGPNNYIIPSDNPFEADANAATRGEIWAYGLRNPYRDSFDRSTGELYLADVGQGAYEEVNRQPAVTGGQNYGWRLREGLHDNPLFGTDLPPGSRTDPIFEYPHEAGVRGSIIGGYVYRGSLLGAAYDGLYFFGDYVREDFYLIDPDAADVFASFDDISAELFPGGFTNNGLVSFGEDSLGELYVINAATGEVFKIVPEPAAGIMVAALWALVARRRRVQ